MGCLTCFIFYVVLILIIAKLFIKLTTGWCRSNVCLVGKTAIITGANTGIGYETALDFAKRGAKVILACRDESRGTDARDKIIKASDNKNIHFKKLDLASLKSVREFAADINKTEEKVDILVNNAGGAGTGNNKSEDGLQILMQINYFGHFLLTNLLLDLLKKTPKSRIVNVASIGARFVKDFDIENLNVFDSNVSRPDLKVYVRSKLCNVLFTIELANRLKGTGVTSYSLHPGVVLTDIFRRMPTAMRVSTETLLNWFFKNSVEGAQTTIHCAVQKGIEDLSGEHFEDCHVVSRYKTAQDPDLPKKLWIKSEQLVKLDKSQ